MDGWLKHLRFDPFPPLLSSENKALQYFCQRDLLGEEVEPVEKLWHLCEAEGMLKKQVVNGSWTYPGGGRPHLRSQEDYSQLETFRMLGELVEKYGLSRQHHAVERAAQYLFTKRTDEGDFRGIYGHQYTPNYSAAIMELLIKAGYGEDNRIDRGFKWLTSMRQNDGGWAIAIRTEGVKLDAMITTETMAPNRSKPSSHMITGVVLRAFAAHEKQQKSEVAKRAGQFLASRFFKKDTYPDRRAPDYWTRFSFPFWFTDLLSSLDSLSRLGFNRDDPQIGRALEWFVSKQQKDGAWKVKTKDKHLSLWTSLAICRVFKRLCA